jgi:hypothetical protein
MELPSDVRLAIAGDEDKIVDMLALRHEEDGLGKFSEARTRISVRRGINRDCGYIGVIRHGRTIQASIGLFVSTPWDSEDPLLAEQWNFVHPDHRRSTHAKNLILFAKWASFKLGVPLLMSKFKNEQTAGLAKLYARQLNESGALYLYRPEQVQLS